MAEGGSALLSGAHPTRNPRGAIPRVHVVAIWGAIHEGLVAGALPVGAPDGRRGVGAPVRRASHTKPSWSDPPRARGGDLGCDPRGTRGRSAPCRSAGWPKGGRRSCQARIPHETLVERSPACTWWRSGVRSTRDSWPERSL